jgi:cell division protease FtsH
VRFTGVRPSMIATFFWSWMLPLLFVALLWSVLSRRFSAVGSSVLGFGRSRAKLATDKNTGVVFADVAGCDEAKHELEEVVSFLKNPEQYEELGAKIPKGVLLVGPPGTGKTLLARAVAGEAGVPFLSISGSDFVEMFVGVGAARVRDLFEQAKKQQPCIVFIDEVDTIGRHRGVHMGMTNDEREQTLNQLLTEMDGFEPNAGVILLAATNRPEVLDRALLRPGRFDRQVVIDAPDVRGREEILKVHSRGKPLAPDVVLAKIARGTPGFSGADLANTMNEAALLATRRKRKQITQRDLEDAIEKVVAGPERKSRRLGEAEKRRVAFHETGHALVAAFCKHADPVHKISIVPRGRAALGYTLQLPEGEQFLMTRAELIDRIRGLLGGRASEELVFGEVSTGAENDLEKATALARQMVCMYGMGEKIGLAHVGQRQRPLHLVTDENVASDCSPVTAREIDEEVKALLDQCYRDARGILSEHRRQLDRVAEELLVRESIDGSELKALLDLAVTPTSAPPQAPASAAATDASLRATRK